MVDTTLRTYLDYNHQCAVTVTYCTTTASWSVIIEIAHRSPHWVKHCAAMLHCYAGNKTEYFMQHGDVLQATIKSDNACDIMMHGRIILSCVYQNDEIRQTSSHVQQLSVFEMRMLGQYPHACLPYERADAEALVSQHQLYVTTDLHTHLTSQISAQDMLDVAIDAGAYYPVQLLELLDIDVTHYHTHPMQSIMFGPAASEGLECEQEGRNVAGVLIKDMSEKDRAILQRAMSIPIDTVFTFDALERQIYRLRNPLSKNPALLRGTIIKVAQDYAAQGVRYAELAVTGALKPKWLAQAIHAIEEAKTRSGVILRMLVGMPRSLSPIKALKAIEKITFLAQHPMIVGVDFLGYEANKTRNFGWALSLVARYAQAQKQGKDAGGNKWTFKDDFIIRVHAGENGKNPDNVAEVMAIAELYGVRVRVGHAAYGNVEHNKTRAIALADLGLLMIEFNPDSNMAMNNIDSADQCPILEWMDAGVPCVLASDGAGIYQTNSAQLVCAGLFAGLRTDHIERIHQLEKHYVQQQTQLYCEKKSAFDAIYPTHEQFINAYQNYAAHIDSDESLNELRYKTAVLIAGASGSSWQRISAAHRREITLGIYMLVALLNPQKSYFAMGRIKREGVGSVLDAALHEHQRRNGQAFDMVGMLSQHQNMPSVAENINHIIPLKGELMSVPHEMTDILKDYNGCALYIGGSAFTRDFIKCSLDKEIQFGVMQGPEGASSQKAKVLHDIYVFHGAIGMVRQLEHMKGSRIFQADADLSAAGLQQCYEQIKKRIFV